LRKEQLFAVNIGAYSTNIDMLMQIFALPLQSFIRVEKVILIAHRKQLRQ
jgi:hypothetical protein